MRKPDKIIGGADDPYLLRWHVIPKNRWFNIYLHKILRDDDDRALHDHPWWNVSIVLKGGYTEHTPYRCKWRNAGSIIPRRPTASHRLSLPVLKSIDWLGHVTYDHAKRQPCWSLFITGPLVREWGFWCPQGWRHWREFCDPIDPGIKGKGCD